MGQKSSVRSELFVANGNFNLLKLLKERPVCYIKINRTSMLANKELKDFEAFLEVYSEK